MDQVDVSVNEDHNKAYPTHVKADEMRAFDLIVAYPVYGPKRWPLIIFLQLSAILYFSLENNIGK